MKVSHAELLPALNQSLGFNVNLLNPKPTSSQTLKERKED